MALLTDKTFVLWPALCAGRWKSVGSALILTAGFIKILRALSWLTLETVLTDTMVVLLGEEAALVAPWALHDALLDAPVPELTQRTQTLVGVLRF